MGMSMGPACLVLWLLHFLYCILHPHGYSVTTCSYCLIPSPLHNSLHFAFALQLTKPAVLSVVLSKPGSDPQNVTRQSLVVSILPEAHGS